MVKVGFFIAMGFVAASGCGIIDNPTPKDANQVSPAVAVAPAPQMIVKDDQERAPSDMPVPIVAPRIFSSDDIRRMQVRLRDVGLDPGPVDGVGGAKTLAAAKRFESGCDQLHDLLDGSTGASALGRGSEKKPGRKDTIALQQRVRSAGFNPGPIDGIFGVRMRTMIDHLQNGCPAAHEFTAQLNQADGYEKNIAPAISTESAGSSNSIFAQEPQEASKHGGTLSAAQSREEIRILQLQLRDAGYDPGPVDGIMGSKTKLALEQMQAAQRSGKGKIIVKAGNGAHY